MKQYACVAAKRREQQQSKKEQFHDIRSYRLYDMSSYQYETPTLLPKGLGFLSEYEEQECLRKRQPQRGLTDSCDFTATRHAVQLRSPHAPPQHINAHSTLSQSPNKACMSHHTQQRSCGGRNSSNYTIRLPSLEQHHRAVLATPSSQQVK